MAIKQPLGEAAVEIVARLDRLEKDFKEARKKSDRTAKDMEKSFARITKGIGGAQKALRRFIAGLAVVGGAGIAGAAVRRNLDFVDSLDKVSEKLGVTTDFLQQAQYAAAQSGIEFNTLSMAMQRFTRRAAEANKGTGEAKDAIKELGIQLTDSNGRLRRTEDLFSDAIAALARIDDPADRLRLAFKLFDSEGAVLVNLADNFKTLADRAVELGIVVDESIIERGVRAKDQLNTLSTVIRANLAGTLVDLAPVLMATAEHLQYIAKWAAQAFTWLYDVLNLKPYTLEAMRDRAGELEDRIASLQWRLKNWSEERRKERLEPLRQELEALRETIRLEEQRLEQVPQRSQVPDITGPTEPEELTAKFKELWKERDRALTQWEEEAQVIEGQWDRLSDSASASMAQMVADGEISFRALGQAFIHEFTERVLRSLVFNRLFSALGSLIGSAFSQATTDIGPFASGYQFDPAYDPLGGFRLDTGPLSGGAVGGSNVQIINATGAPVQTQELFGGNTRVFIGQQGAQDILMGGDMARAIESKYGLSARGVRK